MYMQVKRWVSSFVTHVWSEKWYIFIRRMEYLYKKQYVCTETVCVCLCLCVCLFQSVYVYVMFGCAGWMCLKTTIYKNRNWGVESIYKNRYVFTERVCVGVCLSVSSLSESVDWLSDFACGCIWVVLNGSAVLINLASCLLYIDRALRKHLKALYQN
jgi:hypothetical protein